MQDLWGLMLNFSLFGVLTCLILMLFRSRVEMKTKKQKKKKPESSFTQQGKGFVLATTTLYLNGIEIPVIVYITQINLINALCTCCSLCNIHYLQNPIHTIQHTFGLIDLKHTCRTQLTSMIAFKFT